MYGSHQLGQSIRCCLARICLLIALLPLSSQASSVQDYERGYAAFQREDLVTAINILTLSAERGHAKSQHLLGYIYDIAEENELAYHYYRLAAEQGDPDGAYALGKLYAGGEGVTRDYSQALHWYQAAAQKGHQMAFDVLSSVYLEGGLGLAPDPDKALELLEKASTRERESPADAENSVKGAPE